MRPVSGKIVEEVYLTKHFLGHPEELFEMKYTRFRKEMQFHFDVCPLCSTCLFSMIIYAKFQYLTTRCCPDIIRCSLLILLDPFHPHVLSIHRRPQDRRTSFAGFDSRFKMHADTFQIDLLTMTPTDKPASRQ